MAQVKHQGGRRPSNTRLADLIGCYSIFVGHLQKMHFYKFVIHNSGNITVMSIRFTLLYSVLLSPCNNLIFVITCLIYL